MRLALALLPLLAVAAGCAPAVDLRVPAYDGPAIRGRLLVIHAPIVADSSVIRKAGFPDPSSYETATRVAFERALSETFLFSSVQSTTLPDSATLAPVFVSRQVMREGRAENRWVRRTINLPTVSFRDLPAEYVLVFDTLSAAPQLGTERGVYRRVSGGEIAARVALGVVFGVVTIPDVTTVPGTGIRAPFALYRVGTDSPLIVGELDGFGAGPGGVAPESEWARSVRHLAESLSETGAVETH